MAGGNPCKVSDAGTLGVGVTVDAAVVGVTVVPLAEAAVAAAMVAVGVMGVAVAAGCVRVGAMEACEVAVNVGVSCTPGALLGVGVRLSKIIPVAAVAEIVLVGVGV